MPGAPTKQLMGFGTIYSLADSISNLLSQEFFQIEAILYYFLRKARSSPIAGRAVSSPSASLIARRAADIL